MARTARIVVPGLAHHVTLRGNRRQQTFFTPADYALYIDLVREACRAAHVDILAWCLMPNHLHLVLVPATAEGLAAAMASVHQRYTWVINRRNGWQGHLWQSRFYSSPLDDEHLGAVIRYVELNPLRARLVVSPDHWQWSSVRGRISGQGDKLVDHNRPPSLRLEHDWLAFLAAGLSDDEADRIRRHQRTGTVLGGAAFVAKLEDRVGRRLSARPRGRPPAAKFGRAPVSSLPAGGKHHHDQAVALPPCCLVRTVRREHQDRWANKRTGWQIRKKN